MDATDKLAAQRPIMDAASSGQVKTAAHPFGLRFAVSPIRAGEHSKTYYTVTETEATEISRDGVVETITDQNVKEKED
ncbi:MAG: hypothetical protein ACRDR6_27405 [Pseudonocardiaceae bacterium]